MISRRHHIRPALPLTTHVAVRSVTGRNIAGQLASVELPQTHGRTDLITCSILFWWCDVCMEQVTGVTSLTLSDTLPSWCLLLLQSTGAAHTPVQGGSGGHDAMWPFAASEVSPGCQIQGLHYLEPLVLPLPDARAAFAVGVSGRWWGPPNET